MLVVLAVSLALVAGCIGADEPLEPERTDSLIPAEELTQPIFEQIERTEHVVQDQVHGEDTAQTWVDVYRPADAEDPVPVILVFTPYQSLGDATGALNQTQQGELPVPPEQSPYDASLVEFFTPRGYAVAFADVRGNHNSSGCIDQSGPDQWRDGYAVIEWLGSQDWSNGNVGMYGASYDGETQISTALLNPPSLATIVPTASVDSQYKYTHYQGIPYDTQTAGTMAGYLAISAVPGTHPNAATTYHERFTCQPEALERSLDWSGDWNGYWDDRAYHKLADQADVSMLRIHGLQDWNVKPDHVDPSTNQWAGEPTRAIYGQWGHAYPDRDDWWGHGDILHRWFDEHLHGTDTGIVEALPPVLIEDTQERWHGLDAFPLHDASTLTLHLTQDGNLAPNTTGTGELTVHDYPRNAPGLSMQETGPAATMAGQAVTGHPAELVFESQPLEDELVLTGRPTVEFTATTDAESTRWVAHLEIVEEDGWLNRGYLDATQRETVEETEPLTPGEPYDIALEMFPQADVVEPGDVLRLTLTNTDDWVHQDDSYATSTIQTGLNATLNLPLLPGDATSHGADRLEGLD